eukprot:5161973-Pleurochrysis_carterae.AAC.1
MHVPARQVVCVYVCRSVRSVSFFGVREVMLVDVPESASEWAQRAGRAVRFNGHARLPESECHVRMRLYVSVLPTKEEQLKKAAAEAAAEKRAMEINDLFGDDSESMEVDSGAGEGAAKKKGKRGSVVKAGAAKKTKARKEKEPEGEGASESAPTRTWDEMQVEKLTADVEAYAAKLHQLCACLSRAYYARRGSCLDADVSPCHARGSHSAEK